MILCFLFVKSGREIDSFISPDCVTFCGLIKLTNCMHCDALGRSGRRSGLNELQMALLSSEGLTMELPPTDCHKLALSDFGPKSGVRSEDLQSWATAESKLFWQWIKDEWEVKVYSWWGWGAAARWNHMPVASILRTEVAHTQLSVTRFLHISCKEIKFYSIKSTLKMSPWSDSYRSTLSAK